MSTATELREQAAVIAETTPLVEWKHPSLAAALVAAKAELKNISATQKAKIPTKAGGEFSYNFANLADAVDAVDPVLALHGLAQLTPVHGHERGLACSVILVHESGEQWRFDPFPFPAGSDAQATGSMTTYHRRYALLAALGLAARADDDDGATARALPAWTVAAAKTRLYGAVKDRKRSDDQNKATASAAWSELHGDDRWREWEHGFPQAEVDAWVNADPKVSTGEGVGLPIDTDTDAPAPVEEPEGESA